MLARILHEYRLTGVRSSGVLQKGRPDKMASEVITNEQAAEGPPMTLAAIEIWVREEQAKETQKLAQGSIASSCIGAQYLRAHGYPEGVFYTRSFSLDEGRTIEECTDAHVIALVTKFDQMYAGVWASPEQVLELIETVKEEVQA